MDCEEFAGRLEAYSGPPGERFEIPEHVADCPECLRRLRRARMLADTLRSLEPERYPAGLDESVRAAVAAPRPASVPPLFRAAAAVLLAACAAFAVGSLLLSGPGYQPLDLRFVEDASNGNGEEDLIREEIYGPQTPILAANGGAVRGH